MRDSPQKYRRELLRHLPKGYKLKPWVRGQDIDGQPTRHLGQHPVLFGPDGEVVRNHEGKPVTVAGTPGSHLSMINDLKTIERAGVPVRR